MVPFEFDLLIVFWVLKDSVPVGRVSLTQIWCSLNFL